MRSFDTLMDMCASTRLIQMYHLELGGEEYLTERKWSRKLN